ncbi:TPA: hypothetical protein EYP66_00895 [Candidatus Poribacteria bacterium]|nr:hypothetical protein [Candidatus Poribacteria bacterium]
MEREKMTPREFALRWDENKLFREYEEAESEEKKRSLLEKWGIPDMYEEAERNMWLRNLLEQYPEGEEDPAPRSLEELKEQIQQFELYLRNFQLRDYEQEWLGEEYIDDRIMHMVADNPYRALQLGIIRKRQNGYYTKTSKDVREEFEKLGVLEKIGVAS